MKAANNLSESALSACDGGVHVRPFIDALRGYAYDTHSRDGFRCVYCGWDGSQWPNWLYLSWDHLLLKGDPLRDDTRYVVTACRFCNEAANRTRFIVQGRTPGEIIEAKRARILETRADYKKFWEEHARGTAIGDACTRASTKRSAGACPPPLCKFKLALRR